MPIITALTAAALAAAPLPVVSHGWPVQAPSDATVFPATAGRVIASTTPYGPAAQEVTAAFGGNGLRRWSVPNQAECGICTGYSTPGVMTADGTLANIGISQEKLWSVSTAGEIKDACGEAIDSTGACYAVGRATNAAMTISRVGTWTTQVPPGLAWDEERRPGFAFDTTSVYVIAPVPNATGYPLVALDRTSGAVRWQRTVPSGTLNPVVTPDGTIVIAADRWAIGIGPDGVDRWSVDLQGTPTSMILDAARTRVLLGVASTPSYGETRHRVEAVSQTGVRTRLATGPTALRPLTVTATGTLLLHRTAPPNNRTGAGGALVALRPTGTIAWSLDGAGKTPGTPHVTANGTVIASLGSLLYRLPGTVARAPRRTGMWVTPSRFRLKAGGGGRLQLCPGGGNCTPGTGLGAVIEFRLPAGTPAQIAQFELSNATTGRVVWNGRAAVRPGSTFLPIDTAYSAKGVLRSGRHSLTVRLRTGGVLLRVPVTVMRER